MAERERKLSMRRRFHYWFCDVFNIVSQDYFIEFCENIDRYLYSQNQFNMLVGSKLKLKRKSEMIKHDSETQEDNKERGMFG